MIGFIKHPCGGLHKELAPNRKWVIDNESWELLDKDTADFCFQEGEKLLSSISNIGDKITQRCYALISILISICPLLVGAVVFINSELRCAKSLLSLFVLICIAAICMLFKLVLPRNVNIAGREPRDLVNRDVLIFYNNSKDIKRNILILELERLQSKIDFIKKSNEQRTVNFEIILKVLLITFVIVCVATLFSTYFFSLGSVSSIF